MELTPAVFFAHPTLRGLGAYLVAKHREELGNKFHAGTESGQSMGEQENPSPGISVAQPFSDVAGTAAEANTGSPEPIAIIGMSGCFPQAEDIDAFWQNLLDGKDCITEIPKERWDWDDEDLAGEGNKANLRWAGLINGVDEFDPLFFGISPREAELMDPQQRLLMTYVWKAIEDAGYSAQSLSGSNTAILVGTINSGYGEVISKGQGTSRGDSPTGSVPSIGPNRMSYLLNLHGPSEPIETACSSSLVAIHRGRELIAGGQCEMAVVGGVNTLISRETHLSYSKAGMLSEDGHCKTFSAQANGYVRSEGAGMLVLKQLKAAQRDADHIYGLLRGSAENHGGRSNSLTAPNPEAQAEVIKEAYLQAGVDCSSVGYIEAHGTGTPLGDPIEINALKSAFQRLYENAGREKAAAAHCGLGSAKSNMGHLELAAGVAGVIKVLLQFEHQTLVKTLHCDEINPYIQLQDSPFYIVRENQSWRPLSDEQGKELPRRAGVSSFGFGGVNAHVVLEEYVSRKDPQRSIPLAGERPAVVVLSARNEDRLQEQARRLQTAISTRKLSDLDLRDLAYTLQVGREGMEHRIAMEVVSMNDVHQKLQAFIEGKQAIQDFYRGEVRRNKEALTLFKVDEELQEAIAKWIHRGKFSKLLGLWVKGLEFDWSQLYGQDKPRRISLPAYPFAKERYWIDAAPGGIAAVQRGVPSVYHPLLHSNTSDLSEQRYSSTFTGEEFFLADHQIKTDGRTAKKVLPGVAYLELARAAIEQAWPALSKPAVLELQNTVWAQPIVVAGKTQISLALFAGDDDRIEYEIYSQDGEHAIVHGQGRAVWSMQPPPAPIEINQLQQQMAPGRMEPDSVYQAFARMGVVYGPSFQTITAIYQGPGQVLAQLRLPPELEDKSGTYVLHPAVMDGALQACVGLINGSFEGSHPPRLPFALELLRIVSPCTPQMYAWVRYSPGSAEGDKVLKLDIDLCDRSGNVCVQLRGFSTRVLSQQSGATQATGSLLATPVWQPTFVEAGAETAKVAYSEHHVVLCELSQVDARELESLVAQSRCVPLRAGDSRNIAQRYSDYALACFERIQGLFQGKPRGRVLVQIVVSGDPEQVLFTGLSALLKTAGLENPQLIGQLIMVPGNTMTGELARLLQQESRGLDTVIRYEHGERQISGWQELPPDPESPPLTFKDQGVYLITGGLGGLGFLFAKEILERSRQSRVVLTGRSVLSPEIQARLDELSASAGRLSYRQVDLSNLDQARQLISAMKEEHQHLNGILHAAGMIADNFILKKPASEFGQVLTPKVTGTYNLDQATQDLELDFFLLFSSIVGAMGNLGQADYAAANGFMDQFAAFRNRQVATRLRYGRTLSINWPLWQAGGMKIDRATQERVQQTTGMHPMATASGMQAFYRSLALPYDQILVVEGDRPQMRRALLARAVAPSAAAAEPAVIAESVDKESLREKTQDYLRQQFSELLRLPAQRIDAQAALEKYGIDSILAIKLTNHLEESFGSLAKTLFFEYQTIQELTGYFLAHHAPQLSALFAGNRKGISAAAPSAAGTFALSVGRLISRRRFSRLQEALPTPARDVDPIAIIGLSGRYPEAVNIEAYWRNLREGKDCIVEVPKERWDWREYFSEDRRITGHHFSKWGGFIAGVDEFDPLFFNISPADAEFMDPQERLFLQHAWMAMEDAGYTRAGLQVPSEQDLPGQVGVYAGVWLSEYQLFANQASVPGKRVAIAGSIANIANRVSYALNLHGPSMTLDTMCSSSLTAIHLACQDLKQGRISMAIAGGVNVSIHPSKYLVLSALQAISTDGHCRSFGEGGDGYIPAEGVGVVLLKRLSEAKRDGDQIYGVLRGSALTHGGKTNGYTVPNPQAQASAISRALAESHIDARHISYIEAHGTGTRLGDPIEIAALTKAFRQSTQDAEFCRIGSAKSNIGHCESAAGIAGLTKVLLQMQHQQIVPSLHSAQLNPHIDFPHSPFTVNQSLTPWEQPIIDGRAWPRIAGISSFGAGGSNAHMIVEEYQTAIQPGLVFTPVVILLSARTAAQLQQKAADLLVFVSARLSTIDLVAMAYTLQVGREGMEERLGFTVSTVAELTQKLEAYVAREQGIEDFYHGQVKRNQEALSLFSTDVDLQVTIDKWMVNKKLSKLLELWVKGLELDWSKLYGEVKPQRVSLPTYPFAQERYWIDNAAIGQGAVGASDAAVPSTAFLHPLLHSNTSDLGGQRYRSTFTGQEFFLADHQLRLDGESAQRVLPGVVYLEMARAAVEQASPIQPESAVLELRNTVWMQPIVITQDTQIGIALAADEDGQIDWQISSQAGGQEVIHGQGHAVWSRPSKPVNLDLASLKGQMGHACLEPESIYAAFLRKGIVYGHTFQSIAAVYQGTNQALVHLRLPRSVAGMEGYVLHPSLMDGALQACVAVIEGGFAVSNQTRVPYALQSLRILSPCTTEMYAWVCYSPGSRAADKVIKLDMDLCDDQGRLCVSMKGFAARALEARRGQSGTIDEVEKVIEKQGIVPVGLLTLAPIWQQVQEHADEPEVFPDERLLVIGGDEQQHRGLRQEREGAEVLELDGLTVEQMAEALSRMGRIDHVLWILSAAKERGQECEGFIEDQEKGVVLGFRLIKALLGQGYGAANLSWTVITNGTQRIGGRREQKVDAAHSSAQGLIGSMAKEYPNWKVRLVDVLGSVWPWREMMRLGWDHQGQGWGYREGHFYRSQLVECHLGDWQNPGEAEGQTKTGECGYRRGGVYVVIGGAGGLGEVLTRHLITNYQARVVWIGRREKQEEIEHKQQRVAAGGGEVPLYIAADARHREDLERACKQIKQRYGQINGVIHCAIVLADKSLANMAEEQFRAGLSAKVDVAVRLAQVFGREQLDFILYFSSIQSFYKTPGQSNYASGCTFTDAFAEWHGGQVEYAVKVMNWGYWGSVGVVAGPEFQQRMRQQGLESIAADEGMAGVERLLRAPLAQVAMIRTSTAEPALSLGVSVDQELWAAPAQAPSICERLAWEVPALLGQESTRKLIGSWHEQRRELDDVLVNLLRGQMESIRQIGLGFIPAYERWMKESLRILSIHPGQGNTREDQLWQEWERCKSRWAVNGTGMSAQLNLVETTLRSLGPILRGEKRATDVIFPNSSLHLVEGVYKNTPVPDYFNHVMAEVVGCYAEQRRREPGNKEAGDLKLRLLELGAGTGGSSEVILHKLDGYRKELQEYCYSDLSRVFLLHGERAFGAGREYLKYALLDVERGLEEQGVERGVYDVVIAANVLHATRQIRETLRNAKAALKQNGVLLLNELGANSVFAHLTFGLLDGWWLYQDQELRMEGSPGLTSEAWQQVLEEEGFRRVSFPAQQAPGLGQQIILAESDGIFRQKRTLSAKPGKILPAFAQTIPSLTTEKAEGFGLLDKVQAWLVDAICGMLKVKPQDIDVDAELSEFGFDSISLTGFANFVNQAHGLQLMPTIFFEHATVSSFAKYLVQEHGGQLSEKFQIKSAGKPEILAVKEPVEQSARQDLIGREQRKWGRPQFAGKLASRPEDQPPEPTGNAAEAIAIIGMSGRFPGAEDLDAFWENLKAGKHSIKEIPLERWDWRAFYGDEKEDGHRSSVKWGAFIEGIDEFDPLFFGISPREAELMDPQQRLMMMFGWKAIEDAGYAAGQLWGSRTGIFIGTTNTGYSELLLAQARNGVDAYSAAGVVPSIGPNRLSYLWNLHGPSEPIETACSSSLVAVHRAVRAIIGGECEMALAGGVNTLLTPQAHISFSKSGLLSHDGKCKTFSSRADGYVRGEGVGMVVLKSLAKAERDGDHIYGLIRATAENHGGRANSLTAPNPKAQAELIKEAYLRAGVSPGSVSYIEAHGTGTPLGDPVEINGLKMAFKDLSDELGEVAHTGYCGLGSVKSNIGHLELAAGVAGLIKVLLQLKHKLLVRSLHCEEINPYIQLEESPFYIVRETLPWKRFKDGAGKELPLRAGVSSFGFGGVNAHVVVEEYPGVLNRGASHASQLEPAVVVLSAKDADRLKEQATQLLQAIAQRALSDEDLPALAYTLQLRRLAMEHRVAMTVSSMKELEAKLGDFVAGKNAIEGLYHGEVKLNSETLSVFRGDEELREAVTKWIERGKWPKLMEMWVKGVELDWTKLYSAGKPHHISLPTYPFARERYWIGRPEGELPAANGRLTILHPLLHRNCSDLSEQRYSSMFTGQEFFLADHRIRMQDHTAESVLPAVAYLEMARAAIEQASAMQTDSSILELYNANWLKPLVFHAHQEVSIAVFANDNGQISYEIYTREAEQKTIYCQGQAAYGPRSAPARLDLELLQSQMQHGRLEPSDIYTMFSGLGLNYGPSHQGIVAIDLGKNQLLAQLRLPAVVAASQHDYVLHPSLMDSALQASIGLLVEGNHISHRPSVPFLLESVRILSPCTREMVAWVRYSDGSGPDDKSVRLDIDLCDQQGIVCVQMQGFSMRLLPGPKENGVTFDSFFYQELIASIYKREVSVEQAVELA